MTLGKQLTLWQFISGILLSLFVTYCSYQQTAKQIAAQGAENQRVHDSARLREINAAVSEVSQQLASYASMSVEIQGCLSRPKAAARACLKAPFDYDGLASQKAWANLDANIKAAKPFFSTTEETGLLTALEEVKGAHGLGIKPFLPPDSIEKARSVQSRTEATMKELAKIEGKLEKAVLQRSRERR
jgi:hypothetical protein